MFNEHRGELGILKKKHVGVHKDLEEQKSGLHSMQARLTLDTTYDARAYKT